MKVKEFVDGFKKCKADKQRENFLSERIKTNYIPYRNKVADCKAICDAAYHIEVGNKKIFKFDTPKLRMLYMMHIISLYTDIEFSIENGMDEFELLGKEGLINVLSDILPNDSREMDNILEMVSDDMCENEYSMVSIISSLKDSIGMVFENLFNELQNTITQPLEDGDVNGSE